jgi:RHS repeat-associated protein
MKFATRIKSTSDVNPHSTVTKRGKIWRWWLVSLLLANTLLAIRLDPAEASPYSFPDSTQNSFVDAFYPVYNQTLFDLFKAVGYNPRSGEFNLLSAQAQQAGRTENPARIVAASQEQLKRIIEETKKPPVSLPTAFDSAAAEFGMSSDFLKAVALAASGLEQRPGYPSARGGYGVMQLVQTSAIDRLTEAAKLINVDPELLKTDAALNIRAGAALLRHYAKQYGAKFANTSDLTQLAVVLESWSGYSPDLAQKFIGRVFELLQNGFNVTNSTGETIAVRSYGTSLSAPTVNTALRPANAANPVDYPGAVVFPGTVPAGAFTGARPQAATRIVVSFGNDTREGLFSRYSNAANPKGVHYIVDTDGTVYQLGREAEIARHMTSANPAYSDANSVTIVLVGYHNTTPAPTPALYTSLKNLVQNIAGRYSLPLDCQTVAGLSLVNPDYGTNPSPNLDWSRIIDGVSANCDYNPGGRNLGRSSYSLTVARGINPVNGNFIFSANDLAMPGNGQSVVFGRTYNGQDARLGWLGRGWSYNLEVQLGIVAGGARVDVTYPDGRTMFFTRQSDGSYVPQPGFFEVLTRLGDGSFELLRPDQMKLSFRADGKITAQTDKNGNRIELTYGANSLPVTLKDSAGRIFTLSFANGRLTRIADAQGRKVDYTYDANGFLISVTDLKGATSGYSYIGGLLTSLRNGSGQLILTNEYDSAGRVVKQNYPDGTFVVLQYAPAFTRFIDQRGVPTVYYFDERGHVTRVVDPLSASDAYTYDANDRVTSYTNAAGRTWRYEYDSRGNRTKFIDPQGRVTSMTYDARNNIRELTDAAGRKYTYEYDARGNLTKYSRPDGTSVEAQYDSLGRVESLSDARGNRTRMIYDAAGNVTEVIEPNGKSTKYTYDSFGRPTETVDQEGRKQKYGYDATGNRTSVEDDLGRISKFEYDPDNNLSKFTDRMGNSFGIEYNYNRQSTKLTGPLGYTVQNTYNSLNLQETQIGPRGETTSLIYDALGRVVGREDANKNLTAFEYDGLGNVTKQVSPSGAVTEIQYDILDRPECVIDTLGNRSCVEYDALDRIKATKDNRGYETRYEYDEAGRLIRAYRAPSGITSNAAGPKIPANDPIENFRYEYDANGNQTAKIDGINRKTTYKYDEQNRMVEEIDPAGFSIKMEYNGAGQLVKKTDKRGFSTTYEYDKVGRQIKITDPLGFSTLMEYDKENRVTKEIDKLGRATLTVYDELGRKIRVTDPAGGVELFEYDKSGNVLKQTSPGKRSLTMTYDAKNNKLTETDGLNRTMKYEYDGENRVIRETDPMGRISRISYDKEGRIIAVENPKGGVTSYEYDKDGNVLSITDPLKQITRMTYDSLNRMGSKTDPLGGTTVNTYDDANQLLSVKSPRGRLTTYKYNLTGQAVEVTDREGGVTKNVYDQQGNLIESTNARGFTEKREYDALNRVIKEIDREGAATLKEYDAMNNMTVVTDALGRRTVAEYDALNRRVRVTDALNGVIRYGYDPDGLLLTETNANGHTGRKEYDAGGQLTRAISPRGAETRNEYDLNGNVVAKIDALGNRYKYEYDVLNKVTAEIDPLGRRTELALDALSRKIAIKNPRGFVTRYDFDPLNRITKVTDARGGISSYTYDSENNLTSYTDARGGVDRWTYDYEGRVLTEANPLNNSWRYEYDKVGNRLTSTDARGTVLRYEYDKQNRMTALHYPDNFVQARQYDAVGNLTKLTDRAGVSDFSYDALNRMTAEVRNSKRVAAGYDAVGNMTSLTFPNTWTQRRSYNEDNQLKEVIDQRGGRYNFTRDLLGRDTEMTYPNGVRTLKTFDAAGQLTALVNQGEGNRLLTRYDYTLDANGNRTRINALYDNQADADPGEDYYNGVGPVATKPKKYQPTETAYTNGDLKTLNIQYNYDELDRLTTERHSSGLNVDYTLDPNGNMTRKEVRHSQRQGRPFNYDQTFQYNAANHLTAMNDAGEVVTLNYDPNGNRTLKRTGNYEQEYVYDHENRLVSVDTERLPGSGNGNPTNGQGNGSDRFRPREGVTEYTYDGQGRLQNLHLDRNGNGQDYDATRLYWGKQLIGQEWDGKFKNQDDVYFTLGDGDDIIGSIEHERRPRGNGQGSGNPNQNGRGSPHTLRYHQFDGLGSLVVVTNRIAHVVGSQGFSAYGEQFDHKQLDELPLLGFTGKDYDDSTGLIHFHARWYDPSIARWMNDDPYRGTIENPLTRNRSLYVTANPINKVDPTGNDGVTITQEQNGDNSGLDGEEAEPKEPDIFKAINDTIDTARKWVDEQVGRLADGITNFVWNGIKDFKISLPFIGDIKPQRHQVSGMVHGLLDTVKNWIVTPILDDIQNAVNAVQYVDGESAFIGAFTMIGARVGDNIGEKLGGRIGEKLGSLAGSAIGGPLGGIIGHFVGGFVGGEVGSMIGEDLGGKAGEYIGGLIWDATIGPFLDKKKDWAERRAARLAKKNPDDPEAKALNNINLPNFGGKKARGSTFRGATKSSPKLDTPSIQKSGPVKQKVATKPPKSNCNSFSAETLVLTEQGQKPIQIIKEGEKVLAYHEGEDKTDYYKVTQLHVNEDNYITYLWIDYESLTTTPEHPFYVGEREWVNAGELKPGDTIRKVDGTLGKVQRVETVYQLKTMYNLSVDNAKTFFVGEKKWLVHNTNSLNGELCELLDMSGVKPDGETRIQHLKKHEVNDLQKDVGYHGVFYGNSVRVANEAWNKRKTDGFSFNEGNKTIHIINMPNAGYQGGFKGQGQNLNRVKIVTYKNTNKLVSAYPI